MLVLLISLLVFGAVVLVISSLRSPAVDPFQLRLQAVRDGLRPRSAALERPFINRAVGPAIGTLGRFLLRLTPPSWLKVTEQRLIWAGNSMTLAGFILIWTSTTIGFGIMGFLFAHGSHFGPLVTFLAIGGGSFVGALLPQMLLKGRISDRHYKARKGLPDALDLMTTSVEAGLSLDASLARVAEYQDGPFQMELKTALEEMSLGKSRRLALEDITHRLNVPEVINFVQTLNQAEVTGAPIGQVLRTQAEQVRVMRRQSAEAQAQRAPILMLIPLILFIFPSLFVVLLAPAALTLIDLFKNSPVLLH